MLAALILAVLLAFKAAVLNADGVGETCGCIKPKPVLLSGTSWVPGTPAPLKNSGTPASLENPCLPINAVDNYGMISLRFGDQETTLLYLQQQALADKIISGDFYASRNIREFLHSSQFPTIKIMEAETIFEWTFKGTEVEVNKTFYKPQDGSGDYSLGTVNLKASGAFPGPGPVPTSSVNAVMKIDDIFYLLSGTSMFSYNLKTKTWETFDWTSKGEENPFRARDDSQPPPTDVSALIPTSTHILAFQKKELYAFDIDKGRWDYVGEVATPCDCAEACK